MKWWPGALVVIGAAGLLIPQHSDRQTLILYGDLRGYLSPCGCTSPMSGGLKRAATVVRQLQHNKGAVLAMPGSFVGSSSRQDELKFDAVSESARSLKAGAAGFAANDAGLGAGAMFQADQLSDHRFVASDLTNSPANPLRAEAVQGGFLFGSLSASPQMLGAAVGVDPTPLAEAMSRLTTAASNQKLILVVLYDGNEEQARALAKSYPQIRAITYSSEGSPPLQPLKEGGTVLLTSGSHGKALVTVSFEDDRVDGYSVTDLGPDVSNDPDVSRIYQRYLERVASENLLGELPRSKTARFAGSASCASCHSVAYHTWATSAHRMSLHDLDSQHHGRDPDCVGCHVVGLASTYGFRSELKTPQLANVGCESCHGPALAHAQSPLKVRLPKLNAQVCLSCHRPDNSPKFDFSLYWKKIKH
jgi:predicted CXXCH cytochrome family protein